MKELTHKATLIAASVLAIIVATSPRAEADSTGIVVVTGRATAHERTVIESAILTGLRRAQWSMSLQPFTPKEIETITRCLADDKPWHCLSPLMQPKGVDRIVVAEANPQPDSASKLVIKGAFVVAGNEAAANGQRRCDGCNDPQLTTAAQELTEALLHDMASRGETVLEIHTVPGATALLDDQPFGTTDASGKLSKPALAGPHKLTVQHAGFVTSERPIDLPVAKTTQVDVELGAEPRPPLLVPLAFAGAGVAAAAGGGILIYIGQQDGPNDRRRYTRATPIGVVTGLAGVAAIGYGVYLWLRGPRTDGLTISPTPGGLVTGWAAVF
jgi:hypothetical protein